MSTYAISTFCCFCIVLLCSGEDYSDYLGNTKFWDEMGFVVDDLCIVNNFWFRISPAHFCTMKIGALLLKFFFPVQLFHNESTNIIIGISKNKVSIVSIKYDDIYKFCTGSPKLPAKISFECFQQWEYWLALSSTKVLFKANEFGLYR